MDTSTVFVVQVSRFAIIGDSEYGENEVVMFEDIPGTPTRVELTKLQAFVVARKLAAANPNDHVVIRECVVGQDNQKRSWVNYPEPDKFLREIVIRDYDANGEPLETRHSEDKTALPYTE